MLNITREKLAPLTKETLEMMVVDMATALNEAEANLEALRADVQGGIDMNELEVATERLSGNIPKKEFWNGELSAYRQVNTLLDAIAAKKKTP